MLLLYLEVEWTDGMVPGSFFSSQIFRNFAQLVDMWEADNPGQIDYLEKPGVKKPGVRLKD
jgi:hypothetical protein